MSTGLRDALQKPIRRRVTIRVPPGHARQLDQYRNKSRVVRDATHAYLTAYADSNTTIQQPDDALTKCGSSDRLSIRVTQELLDDIHTLIDEGHAPTRSAVIRRAIARYLDGRQG
jgi:metal-responsive CopG/Arc/MetJ family transcriptional regulator